MKKISYFKKLIAGGIMLMTAFFLCATLTSCEGDDDPDSGGDNRSGTPYKFRVEISAEKPDEFDIQMNMGNYNWVDENGFPRTFWLFEDSENTMLSPCIQEYEIPRNFNKVSLAANLHSLVILRPMEETFAAIIIGKLYVNDKLLADFSSKFAWHFSITYDVKSKEYYVSTSDGKSFFTSKLD